MKGVFDYFDGPLRQNHFSSVKIKIVWINFIVDDPSAEVIPLLLVVFR